MTELCGEKIDLWQRLQKENRPVVLYGMGNGADKILAQCEACHISVQDIFASDEFVRGHSFHGYQVKKYCEIKEKYTDCIILLAFAAFQPDLLQKIYGIAEEYEVLAPDVPLFGDDIFTLETLREHEEELCTVENLFADKTSQRVFRLLLDYKISGKISYLKEMETPREEVFAHIFSFGKEESYVDLGAYNGDTVEEFRQQTSGQYKAIYAVEPDVKNFKKLSEKVSAMNDPRIALFNCGAWEEDGTLCFSGKGGRNSCLSTVSGAEKGYSIPVRSVDSILQGAPVSYIKMDVEGAEREAIFGCRRTIKQYAPKLAISAYHYTNDFFTLPLLVHRFNPNYKIYLRHHPYIPAWETNLYAII